jgi:hypothetical protein
VDGACAALAVVASLLRSGDAGIFAQRVEQRDARLEVERKVASVDAQANRRGDR